MNQIYQRTEGSQLMKKLNNHRPSSFLDLFRQLRTYIPPHSFQEAGILIGVACLLIGILLTVMVGIVMPFYAAWTIFDTNAFLKHATGIAQGNVVSFDQQISAGTSPGQVTTVFCNNTIMFQTADGKSITFYEKGDSCGNTTQTVLYNPSHPSEARTSESVHTGLVGAYIIEGIYALLLLLTITGYGPDAIKKWRTKSKVSALEHN